MDHLSNGIDGKVQDGTELNHIEKQEEINYYESHSNTGSTEKLNVIQSEGSESELSKSTDSIKVTPSHDLKEAYCHLAALDTPALEQLEQTILQSKKEKEDDLKREKKR